MNEGDLGKYEGDFFGWEPTVESIGSNYFVGKLTSIAAKRESLALAWAVQGPLAEYFPSLFPLGWPQVASVQQEKWSRHDGSAGSRSQGKREPWFPSVNHFL